jgi:hypothetical protein
MNQILRSRQVAAGVVVSLVTLTVVGLLLVAYTPVGCGPAKALGLKSVSKHCIVTQTVAARPTPSPSPLFFPPPSPESSPYVPPASPPYNPPASQPYPPFNPGSSASSPPFPPFYPPSSGPGPLTPPLVLSCRLPVYVGPPGSGGFITYPSATFSADPSSGVTLPSPSPGSPSPVPPPYYGQQNPGLTYDVAFKKWLPALWTAVTPDGSRYAYTSPNSIYVTNVADNSQVELGEGKAWIILAAQAEGVYAINPNVAGLWLLPYSGPARQITTTGYWQAEAAGAAYGTESSALPQGVSTTINRLDVATGASTAWFTRSGGSSSVVGFDGNGSPIIFAWPFSGQGPEVWIASSASSALPIMGASQGITPNGTPIADSHGVWFSGAQNYPNGTVQLLYVAGSGVYGMSSIGANLAGGCN